MKLTFVDSEKYRGITELFVIEKKYAVANGVFEVEDGEAEEIKNHLTQRGIKVTEYTPAKPVVAPSEAIPQIADPDKMPTEEKKAPGPLRKPAKTKEDK